MAQKALRLGDHRFRIRFTTVLSTRFCAAISALVAAGRGLILGFALGVNGLGGVFNIRFKTSSRDRSGGFGTMDISEAHTRALLAALIKYPDAERDRKYYEALGRFVTSYARAEIQVHVLTRHYSTAKDEQARIMLHRLGLKKVTEMLRELMDGQIHNGSLIDGVLAKHTYNEVESCLSQLAIISNKRGDLVHRMSLTSDDGFEVNNALTAKKLASYEQGVINLSDLEAMTRDCGVIFLCLSRVSNPPRAGFDPLPRLYLPPGPPPWQYKPPEQAPQKEAKMKARKARKLQRAASRGKPTGSGA